MKKLNEQNYTRRIIKRIYFRTKTKTDTESEKQRESERAEKKRVIKQKTAKRSGEWNRNKTKIKVNSSATRLSQVVEVCARNRTRR